MKKITLLLSILMISILGFSQNLIENGDFEFPGTALDTVPAPWGGFKNRIIRDTVLNTFVGQVENGDGSLFQEFGVTPGDTFIVAFNYKWVNSAAANSVMNVRVKDALNLPTNLDMIGGTTANGFKLDETVDQWFNGATFSFVPPMGVDSVRLLFFKGNGNKPLNLDSVNVVLKVPCVDPTAGFAFVDTNELEVTFTNESSGSDLSYTWTFGDGDSSMMADPVHTYDSAGTYEVCLFISDTCGGMTSFCDSVTVEVEDATSIEKEFPYEMSVYPNPVNSMLNISTSQRVDQVEIFNMFGELVLRKTTRSNDIQVNVSELAKGTYILRAHIGNSVGSYRLLKL